MMSMSLGERGQWFCADGTKALALKREGVKKYTKLRDIILDEALVQNKFLDVNEKAFHF